MEIAGTQCNVQLMGKNTRYICNISKCSFSFINP